MSLGKILPLAGNIPSVKKILEAVGAGTKVVQAQSLTASAKPFLIAAALEKTGKSALIVTADRDMAEEIYAATWEWLRNIKCASKVSPQLLERYAMCSARWIQCEELTNKMGLLSKHPTTGKPIPSPFVNIGINYMNQACRLWGEIFQIVKENCSTDYDSTPSPQDDVMERLLRARKG